MPCKNLCNSSLGNHFFKRESTGNKNKNGQKELHKTNKFLHSKDTSPEWEKISEKHTLDDWLVSKRYKKNNSKQENK